MELAARHLAGEDTSSTGSGTRRIEMIENSDDIVEKKRTIESYSKSKLERAIPILIHPLLNLGQGRGPHLDLWVNGGVCVRNNQILMPRLQDRDHFILAKLLATLAQLITTAKNTVALAKLSRFVCYYIRCLSILDTILQSDLLYPTVAAQEQARCSYQRMHTVLFGIVGSLPANCR